MVILSVAIRKLVLVKLCLVYNCKILVYAVYNNWHCSIYPMASPCLMSVNKGKRYDYQLRNECLFFWVHGGMNRSAGQTNRVSLRAICLFRAKIHSPWTQKKDTHSLYLQCFQQRPFLKFFDKSYKFKISTVTGTYEACASGPFFEKNIKRYPIFSWK